MFFFLSTRVLELVSQHPKLCPTRVLELVSTQNCAAQLVFSSWSTSSLIVLPNSYFRVGQLPKLCCPTRIFELVSTHNCAAQLVFSSWSAPKITLPNSFLFDLISSENSALPNSYFASWSAPKITLPNSCFRVGQLRKLCSDQL